MLPTTLEPPMTTLDVMTNPAANPHNISTLNLVRRLMAGVDAEEAAAINRALELRGRIILGEVKIRGFGPVVDVVVGD